MNNILLTIAGILLSLCAYFLILMKTYVVYDSHPRAYLPKEIKGLYNYHFFSKNAYSVSTANNDKWDLKGAIVRFKSGPDAAGKIQYGCYPGSLTKGHYPFKGNALMHIIFALILLFSGKRLIYLSLKKE